jgi:hypothetical protein
LFDKDPIGDPDPAFHPDADPDPDPSFQIKAKKLKDSHYCIAAVPQFYHLCTGVSPYAPYSLLLISKFWMGRGGRWGVGGGEARGVSWRGRIKGVEG